MKDQTNSLEIAMNQDLAYDLRQRYAKIVGDHMEDIAEARKSDNFYVWYKNLEDLYTIVKHKFKLKKNEKDEYPDLILKFTKAAQKHPAVWSGQSQEANGFASIEKSLRDIEMYLYKMMDASGIFGSQKKIVGL